MKIQIGRLNLPSDPHFYQEQLALLHAQLLPVEGRHAFELLRLPLLHRDPLDRLLVAQARRDSLVLVTRDSAFRRYGVDCVW